MAITISGINNNDRIVATDGTIDALSGFNVVGVMTATSFSGNLIGNVTGNINNTTLLLQTSGTERIRITGNNEIGIAGANYGTAGQVLTSGGSGSAVSWTTINQGVTSDGSQNTVGGSNAGDSIISGGTENTVFGYNAGTAITNGDSNTFFGSRAGRSVSTGLSNTGVGYNVMGNASGTDNAALGMDAGNGMGDGRYHVAIGKGAFSNTNQIGSQQNNIVIGYLADVSGNTVSNEMTLGNTNINHVRIPGIGVSFSEGGAVISGIVTATSYRGDGSQLTGISQVGGASTVSFNDNVPIYFGDNNDYKIYFNNSKMSFEPTHSGTQQFEMVSNNQMYIHAKASGLFLRASNQEVISIYGGSGGGVYFRHNGTQKLKLEGGNFTYENGATVTHASHVYIPDSIIHVGDTNTKIRFPSADTITFETAGSERARFTKDGNLFVGSNVSQFYPYNSFTNDALFMVNGNLPTINGAGQATILTKAAYDASDRRALLSFGGYYSSSAQGGQTFLAGIGGEKENTTNSNFAGALMFYTRPHGGNETERLRIDSSGRIGVNTPTPIGTLDVYDGTFVLSKPNASGGERNWRFVNNNVAAGNLGLQVSTAAGGSTFSNVVEITRNGLIGIGEGTPDRRIHLKDPAQIKLESTGTGNWSGLEFMASSGTNNYDAYMGMQDSDGVFFIDNNSDGHDFKIDRSGRITTPSQPSFRITKSGGPFNTGGATVVWDNVIHNEGSHYNTSNGRFTAPVAGTYIFHYYSIYQYNSSNDLWDFKLNGSTFAGSRMHFSSGSVSSAWDNITNTQIIKLSANDYVEIYATDHTLHGGDWSHFCGHLLG